MAICELPFNFLTSHHNSIRTLKFSPIESHFIHWYIFSGIFLQFCRRTCMQTYTTTVWHYCKHFQTKKRKRISSGVRDASRRDTRLKPRPHQLQQCRSNILSNAKSRMLLRSSTLLLVWTGLNSCRSDTRFRIHLPLSL